MSPTAWGCHSTFCYVSPEKYRESLPELFNLIGDRIEASQLCYANPMTWRIAFDSLKGFVTEGEVTRIDPGKGFFGTGFVFRKDDGDMNAMFNYMAENGYRHHVAFAYGRNADAVREALVKYRGYEIERI